MSRTTAVLWKPARKAKEKGKKAYDDSHCAEPDPCRARAPVVRCTFCFLFSPPCVAFRGRPNRRVMACRQVPEVIVFAAHLLVAAAAAAAAAAAGAWSRHEKGLMWWDCTMVLYVGSCCVLRAACWVLRAACCVLPAACCVLSAACCVLPAACCLLRAACCLRRAVRCPLAAACCLLRVAC